MYKGNESYLNTIVAFIRAPPPPPTKAFKKKTFAKEILKRKKKHLKFYFATLFLSLGLIFLTLTFENTVRAFK